MFIYLTVLMLFFFPLSKQNRVGPSEEGPVSQAFYPEPLSSSHHSPRHKTTTTVGELLY
jgi:hypothetical protein